MMDSEVYPGATEQFRTWSYFYFISFRLIKWNDELRDFPTSGGEEGEEGEVAAGHHLWVGNADHGRSGLVCALV